MSITWAERKRREAVATAAAERAKVRDAFLSTLAKGLSVTAAAKAAGRERTFFTDWRAEDQTFAKAWDSAIEEGTDFIEDQGLRRATVGWSEPIFNHGKQVGTKTVYDSVLLIALLNARRPDKFKRSTRAESPGKGAPAASQDVTRDRILAKLRAVADGSDKAKR